MLRWVGSTYRLCHPVAYRTTGVAALGRAGTGAQPSPVTLPLSKASKQYSSSASFTLKSGAAEPRFDTTERGEDAKTNACFSVRRSGHCCHRNGFSVYPKTTPGDRTGLR